MESKDLGFEGKVAVVTGGMGGLGREIVSRFLQSGMKVAVPARNGITPDALPAAWEFAKDRLFVGVADISDESDVRGFLAETISRFGGV